MTDDTPPPPDLTDRALYRSWTGVTVRFRDLDPNRHVNNGAINQFFEDGRVVFREHTLKGFGEDILQGFALRRFAASYHAPLGYPGTVEVGTAVTRVGRSSFELGQAVFGGGRCVATAEVVSVFFDPATGRSRPLPDAVRQALERAVATGTGNRPDTGPDTG